MYKPLGMGDAQITEVIRFLDSINYQGKLVLEQDVMLSTEPQHGTDPAKPWVTSPLQLDSNQVLHRPVELTIANLRE